MDTTIVKLLYDYTDIREISRLRPVCSTFRDLIDRDFEMLFTKALNKIDHHNDINLLLMLVFRKRDLFIRVLRKVKNATGFVLETSGIAVFTLIAMVYPDDKELTDCLTIPSLPTAGLEDRIGMAYREDLPTFKKSYYANKEGMMPNLWGPIITEYIHGLFERNTHDFQIDWTAINRWNKSPFFRFIKGGLKKIDYANILAGIGRLSNETLKRNEKQIVDFAKGIFIPMIEEEITLIADIQEGVPVKITGYNFTLNRRMPDVSNTDVDDVSTYHKLQFVVAGSVTRGVLATSALVSNELFQYIWQIANEVFNFVDDTMVKDIRRNAFTMKSTEILDIINPIQMIQPSVLNIMAFIRDLIPLECFEANSYQKLKMLLIKSPITDETFQSLSIDKEEPVPPLLTEIDVVTPMFNRNWMSKKHCLDLIDNLDDLGLWDKIPYFYDIFITRDLEFWVHFTTQYADSINNDPELKQRIIMFNVIMNNVDFIRFAIDNGFLDTGLHNNVGACMWFAELITEHNEKNNIRPQPPFQVMDAGRGGLGWDMVN
jgi:hypothetical protein